MIYGGGTRLISRGGAHHTSTNAEPLLIFFVVRGLGRTREGREGGRANHCGGGIFHWGCPMWFVPRGRGVYYIIRGGGVGGFMLWVMSVH